jgi:hypothetical protein
MRALTAMWTCAAMASAAAARAEDPPLSDLHGREPAIADLTPTPSADFEPPEEASLSVTLSARLSEERKDYLGGLLLSFPSDWPTSASKAKRAPVIDEPTQDAGDPNEGSADEARPGVTRARPRSSASSLPRIRPRDARAAIQAAESSSGEPRAAAELDDMASRARWSALLPELRLRATRLVDESTSLSPTSYDADRTTASGGISLWLEARTTWSLDRLVFASEEVRIGQIHRQLAAATARRNDAVVEQLFAWQRAIYAMHDPTVEPARCMAAWLDAEQLAAQLDLATNGWFGRWLRGKDLPPVDCAWPVEPDSGAVPLERAPEQDGG